MKILIIGGGGREHAIAWKAAQSSRVEKIYCAPGNAGISQIAECVPIGVMEFDRLLEFAKEKEIDLTIVGMEDPLVGGIVDRFEEAGLRIFGPRKNAAILEGSKAFSKNLMKKYGIPTAAYETFTEPEAALSYLETAKFPIVLKADGLAQGKGVLICKTKEEAKEGVQTLMLDKKFAEAGNEIVAEEFLTGREFLKFFLEINEGKIPNLQPLDAYFDEVQIAPDDRDKLLVNTRKLNEWIQATEGRKRILIMHHPICDLIENYSFNEFRGVNFAYSNLSTLFKRPSVKQGVLDVLPDEETSIGITYDDKNIVNHLSAKVPVTIPARTQLDLVYHVHVYEVKAYYEATLKISYADEERRTKVAGIWEGTVYVDEVVNTDHDYRYTNIDTGVISGKPRLR